MPPTTYTSRLLPNPDNMPCEFSKAAMVRAVGASFLRIIQTNRSRANVQVRRSFTARPIRVDNAHSQTLYFVALVAMLSILVSNNSQPCATVYVKPYLMNHAVIMLTYQHVLDKTRCVLDIFGLIIYSLTVRAKGAP